MIVMLSTHCYIAALQFLIGDAFNNEDGAGMDAQEEDDWGFNDDDEDGKAD